MTATLHESNPGLPAARDRELTAEETAVLNRLLRGRLDGAPVQYLVQEASFRDLLLVVGPGVFIPRPETEGLVDHVLAYLRQTPVPDVLELGVGSGAILASLLQEHPGVKGVGIEKSGVALGYARRNLQAAGLTGRAVLYEGDLFDALPPGTGEQTFHAVVSNPPYIPEGAWEGLPRDVRDFEPPLALLGGPDGLDVIRRIIAGAPRYLRDEGLLALEMDESHEVLVKREFGKHDAWETIDVVPDLSGRPRYCLARTRRRSRSMRVGRGASD